MSDARLPADVAGMFSEVTDPEDRATLERLAAKYAPPLCLACQRLFHRAAVTQIHCHPSTAVVACICVECDGRMVVPDVSSPEKLKAEIKGMVERVGIAPGDDPDPSNLS